MIQKGKWSGLIYAYIFYRHFTRHFRKIILGHLNNTQTLNHYLKIHIDINITQNTLN